MALSTQVVDLIRLRFLDDAREVAGVAQIAIVQLEAGIFDVRVLVDVIYPGGVKAGCAAFDAVHGVAFSQQKFGQIGAVLTGDASD